MKLAVHAFVPSTALAPGRDDVGVMPSVLMSDRSWQHIHSGDRNSASAHLQPLALRCVRTGPYNTAVKDMVKPRLMRPKIGHESTSPASEEAGQVERAIQSQLAGCFNE